MSSQTNEQPQSYQVGWVHGYAEAAIGMIHAGQGFLAKRLLEDAGVSEVVAVAAGLPESKMNILRPFFA